jgi:hypothetical protein
MHHALPLAAVLMGLAVTGCLTPVVRPRPTPAPSFDAQVFATVGECCTSCRQIVLAVRNPTHKPFVLDLSRTRFAHNRTPVTLTFDSGPALVTVGPRTTWRGILRPPAGAPNPASLKEGRFRNGHYRIMLAVLEHRDAPTGAVEMAVADMEIDYRAMHAARDGYELPEQCQLPTGDRATRGRPTGWPEPTAGAPGG